MLRAINWCTKIPKIPEKWHKFKSECNYLDVVIDLPPPQKKKKKKKKKIYIYIYIYKIICLYQHIPRKVNKVFHILHHTRCSNKHVRKLLFQIVSQRQKQKQLFMLLINNTRVIRYIRIGRACSMHGDNKTYIGNFMWRPQRKRVLVIHRHWWKNIKRHIQKQDVRTLTKFNWYRQWGRQQWTSSSIVSWTPKWLSPHPYSCTLLPSGLTSVDRNCCSVFCCCFFCCFSSCWCTVGLNFLTSETGMSSSSESLKPYLEKWSTLQ
jgi:hypothetical protein